MADLRSTKKESLDFGKMFNMNENDEKIVHQHNLNTEQYKDEVKSYLDNILSQFAKIGKGRNDTIRKDELLKFLDSRSTVNLIVNNI